MLLLLTTIATIFFLAHVVLMLVSFKGGTFSFTRYFFSHLTLWLAGLTVFIMATIYHEQQYNSFLSYFDTMERRLMILAFTFGLSAVAHLIVRLAVMPAFRKKEALG